MPSLNLYRGFPVSLGLFVIAYPFPQPLLVRVLYPQNIILCRFIRHNSTIFVLASRSESRLFFEPQLLPRHAFIPVFPLPPGPFSALQFASPRLLACFSFRRLLQPCLWLSWLLLHGRSFRSNFPQLVLASFSLNPFNRHP